MADPTYDEMEAKRQQMIASFKDIAAAMTRCVSIIEDYARASPIGPPKPTRNHNSNIASSLLTSSDIPISPQQPSKEEPKKERKVREKKIKDPNAPKRPPSAYILFQNEVRQQIRETNTGMPYKEVLGIIAEKWKTLPDDQKRLYEAAYADAHATFREQETEYNKNGTVAPAAISAPPAPMPNLGSSSEETDSDTTDSDDDSPVRPDIINQALTNLTTPSHLTPTQKSRPPTTMKATPTNLALPVAPKPAAAKKERKRKVKEDEAVVNASLGTGTEEKKKKKVKEAAM